MPERQNQSRREMLQKLAQKSLKHHLFTSYFFKSLDQKQREDLHTLFLEHPVGFLDLGLVFQPQSPAVEDLRHPVLHRLWRPRPKVLFRKPTFHVKFVF